MKNDTIKKVYSDILTVCDKYVDEKDLSDYEFEDIRKMRDSAKNHLFIVDWNEKYGLEIKHDRTFVGYNWVKIDEHRCFSYFDDAKAEQKKGSGRYISWEDDGKQPNNEWLLCISFSTGAYIFGDDYPVDLFQEFFQELKSHKAKYCDSTNNDLYFSLEDAKDVYNNFQLILNKYREKNKEESKARKIKRMEEELLKLKS